MAKPNKAPKAPQTKRAPREGITAEPLPGVAAVATQITDLVKTAQQAEVLSQENVALKVAFLDTERALEKAEARAHDYMAEAQGITEQDLKNLQTLRAEVTFEFSAVTGKPKVTIQGTGRRRIGVTAQSLPAALALIRPLMGKVPS